MFTWSDHFGMNEGPIVYLYWICTGERVSERCLPMSPQCEKGCQRSLKLRPVWDLIFAIIAHCAL